MEEEGRREQKRAEESRREMKREIGYCRKWKCKEEGGRGRKRLEEEG